MKKGLFYLCVLFIGLLIKPQTSNAQYTGSKNAVYAELLGNGLIFSANYDRRIINNIGGRVGVGYVGSTKGEGGIVTFPIMANIILGKNNKFFEIGAGLVFVNGTGDFFGDESVSSAGTLSLMYRYQPADGGVMWKAGFAPIIAEGVFIPYWIGLSIGYAW
ncbi:MAG TPA: hypothetical protein PK611_08470 [Saprospiraceae bacterium]|nr:hypothetical protein [Saprospiraceae bacterium]HRO08230.1 hypothetical protein [Saprospiraceae bacterium]HRO73689.1 hypothetical protein [Saprospiraceae bacterium]HRP41121.1 hypothetical protein [Saprospiraceae bacterium]